eukprot:7433319-Lingulodinium_polyedra.AAC.1
MGATAAPNALVPIRVGIWPLALLDGRRDIGSASQAFVDCLLATTGNARCKCPRVELDAFRVNSFGVLMPSIADEAL